MDVSFKDGWSQVFVCGQHCEILVVWQCSEELSGHRRDVVFPFLQSQVASASCGDLVVEGMHGLLHLWCGLVSFKVTFNPEFFVKLPIITAFPSLVPEPLESDVSSQPLTGSVNVGFGKRFLCAKLEAIPQEQTHSWGWLFCGAQVMEGCVLGLVQVEELGGVHLGWSQCFG